MSDCDYCLDAEFVVRLETGSDIDGVKTTLVPCPQCGESIETLDARRPKTSTNVEIKFSMEGE